MKTRLEFPAKKGQKTIALHWWHGPNKEIFKKYNAKGDGNTLFVGEKGTIAAGFNGYQANLNDGSTPTKPKETIPQSPGFYNEWINACKGGPRSTCDFVNYAGPLAESVLLANAAFRAGGGFDWNAKELKATENPNVDPYLFPEFRKGWKVD